jgi:hypothetical protein
MAECFAGDEDDMPTSYPLTYMQIHTEQQNNEALKDYINSTWQHIAPWHSNTRPSPTTHIPKIKIVIPQTLQKKAVKF